MNNESKIYIPESHKKYNVLPNSQKYNYELIIWDQELLNKIRKLTNMSDHETLPYSQFHSYQELYQEIDSWIIKYPEYEDTIMEYKKSLEKMNNKDLWAIVKYIGKSNYSFTKDKYYYVVMIHESDEWKVEGIVDNEEYSCFMVWKDTCSETVNLNKDFEIIIDPSYKLENMFEYLMQNK